MLWKQNLLAYGFKRLMKLAIEECGVTVAVHVQYKVCLNGRKKLLFSLYRYYRILMYNK